MSCGDINFLQGGAIKDCNLICGTATETDLLNCKLKSPVIQNLACIDSASIQTIVNEIACLPCDHLIALAKALRTALEHNECGASCQCKPKVMVASEEEDDCPCEEDEEEE